MGPIFAIILLNCVIFVIVTAVLIKHTLQKSKHRKTHTTTVVRQVIAIAGLTFLFGLTWVFGAGTVLGARLVFSILFVVFNAFQGFLVFLMFCVLSTDAQQAWHSLLCKGWLSNVPVFRASRGQFTKRGEKVELPALHAPTSSTRAKGGDENGIEESSSDL